MARDQRGELRNKLPVQATLEVRLEPVLERGETQLLECRRVGCCEGSVESAERLAAPERVRLAKERRAMPRRGRRSRLGQERAEPVEVELAGLNAEHVAPPRGLDRLAELLPEPRYLRAHGRYSPSRRDGPQLVK